MTKGQPDPDVPVAEESISRLIKAVSWLTQQQIGIAYSNRLSDTECEDALGVVSTVRSTT